MSDHIFSSIIVAAIIEFATDFLPLSSKSSLLKYLRYIISLVVVLCIISPIVSFFRVGSFDIFEQVAGYNENAVTMPSSHPFVYITQTGVYSADADGNQGTQDGVFCDIYITESIRKIADFSKDALCTKFSLDKKDITIDIAADVSDTKNIVLISAHLSIDGAKDYLTDDACDFLENTVGCDVRKK